MQDKKPEHESTLLQLTYSFQDFNYFYIDCFKYIETLTR
jgi:hypothetical protein